MEPRAYDDATVPVEPVEAVPVQHIQPVQPVIEPSPSYRTAQVVYLILGIFETLLLIRVVLRLLAANPAAGFTSFIYGVTGPLVAPFQGVFPNTSVHNSVFDLAAILAMIIYALLAWVIVRVVEVLARRQPV